MQSTLSRLVIYVETMVPFSDFSIYFFPLQASTIFLKKNVGLENYS